jgi:hypothetical protein
VHIPGGRPDLVISGPRRLFVFEAKVESWLHEGQLASYAALLAERKVADPNIDARLFLIAPHSRQAALEDAASEQVRGVEGAAIEPKCIAWEAIAEMCAERADHHGGDRLGVYLSDFAELLRRRVGDLPRAFTDREVEWLRDPLAARAIVKTRELLDAVKEMLVTESGQAIEARPANGRGWIGYDLKTATMAIDRPWWIGLWFDVWANVGGTPLFLHLTDRDVRDEVPGPAGIPMHIPYVAPTSTGRVVPLTIRSDIELPVATNELAGIVLAYMRHCGVLQRA